jgi:hypothetical protein
MTFYLLAIRHFVGNKKNARRFRRFNCSSEELIANYVQPYNNNVPFLVSGKKVMRSQIEQFLIFSSPSTILPDMLLSTGTKIADEKHDVMVKCLLKGELGAVEVTSEFLHPLKNKEPQGKLALKEKCQLRSRKDLSVENAEKKESNIV